MPFSEAHPCRVLLADDSLVIKRSLTKMLDPNPAICIVGEALNGEHTIEKTSELKPDVVLLDIEIPVLSAIEALPRILAASPITKVIMLSTLTRKNAEVALHALDIGASDYLEKPNLSDKNEAFSTILIEKILSIAESHRYNSLFGSADSDEVTKEESDSAVSMYETHHSKPWILAIGASTGGPPVLTHLLQHLKGAIQHIPVVITQHIPKEFDVLLAETLTQSCKVPCIIPKDGEMILAGNVYLAPGDFHMEVIKSPDSHEARIRLLQTEKEHFCRPSVNPMLRSIAKAYGKRALAVILTGMGKDGLEGAIALHQAGGTILAQDKETSVVWGMPGAVANAGICTDILSKDALSDRIKKIL
jgi:two-component system chemotaxis response regulator CheB